jgi:hypothetical protein
MRVQSHVVRSRRRRLAIGAAVTSVVLGLGASAVALAGPRTADVGRPMAPGPLCAPHVTPLGGSGNAVSPRTAYVCRAPRGRHAVLSV